MDMWDKFRKKDRNCVEYRFALEALKEPEVGEAEGRAGLSLSLPAKLTAHAEGCEPCKTAAKEFWESRRLLAGAFFQGAAGGKNGMLRGENAPWLVTRVMAKIAERELEERRAKVEWSGAVSRLASRVAWAAAATLLVTSTWLYQPADAKRGTSAAAQTATESASPYLFDSGAAASVDDALAGGGERQQ